MKRTIVVLSLVIVALVLVILFGTPKAQIFNSSAAIAAPSPMPAVIPMPERCPDIHEAIGALEAAQNTLREAHHDFCGHKHDAMEAVHHAIDQLRAAEGCERCREHGDHDHDHDHD